MCACGIPTINGVNMTYRWQPTNAPSIRNVNPPDLIDGDVLLHDEPGRCGGIDSHCHHYRIVRRNLCGSLFLLVRHGGGDERVRLSLYGVQRTILDDLKSNDRYWLMNAIYHAHSDGGRKGREETTAMWRKAAVEKRIKTRKQRGTNAVKVWIE